jgi:drug/metabolite transporter (DMT)-like permease/RimJ/RimL family protein N-acetyltransferase
VGAVLLGSALFAVNGTVSKVVLRDGMSSLRLVEIRCLAAAAVFFLIAAAARPASLAIGRRELGFLVVYGITGIALVQWLYLVAIGRLPVGLALLIEYTAPLLVALWVRFVRRGEVRARMWVALVLSLAGLAVVAQVWSGVTLDGLGVLAALGAAVSYAAYYLLGEHGLGRRDERSLMAWSFLAAGGFWSILQPWWSFPFGRLDDRVAIAGAAPPVWALIVWVVLLGTVAPFALFLYGLARIGAARTGLIGTTEPVLAGLVAWSLLDEVLTGWQLAGAAIVLTGIALAETARSARRPGGGIILQVTADPAPTAKRIHLVQIPAEAMAALLADDLDTARVITKLPLTSYFISDHSQWLWRYRVDQIHRDPISQHWVARAVVDDETGAVVGHAGFHGPPDAAGMVEVGYSTDPEHRREGYARAMVRELLHWAAGEPHVSIVRATISPDNAASLATIAGFGFSRVGEQWDDEDGLEVIFELRVRDAEPWLDAKPFRAATSKGGRPE